MWAVSLCIWHYVTLVFPPSIRKSGISVVIILINIRNRFLDFFPTLRANILLDLRTDSPLKMQVYHLADF